MSRFVLYREIFFIRSVLYQRFHCICLIIGIFFLQAAKRNLVYPHYGWIMFSWYPKRWWTEEVAGEHIDECTDEETEQFLIRAQPLLISLASEPDDFDVQTVAGFVSACIAIKTEKCIRKLDSEGMP